MIDIKLIRDNPGLVSENIKKRNQEDKLAVLDSIIKNDSAWRKTKSEVDSLRAERNNVSAEVAKAKKAAKSTTALMKRAKEIPDEMKKLEEKADKLREKIDSDLPQIPNILDDSVPAGKNGDDNVELRKWGKIPKSDFELKSHSELIESWGMADFEAGRRNSGAGFNYLLNDMALLDHALQRYGLDFIVKKGFIPVVPPMLINKDTFLGAASGIQDIEEVVYKIEGEDLFLVGTAEHTLVGLNKSQTLNDKDLPLRLCALTPCFRKEIGSRGVDTKGLFRMHQFNKVEQVVFCRPEDSKNMLEEMQKITEEFFQSLNIPYRVIEICSGDLSPKFAKQYDIEAWFPRQEKYAEVTSAGNCTDFQARSLNIKYWDKGERKLVHVLNNTMVATSRAMVSILENYQQKDGTVKVPEVLVPYMHGKKIMGKKN
jgi:seryl-tRNA synthetase